GAALVPLVIRDAFFLDSLVLILLWGALSAAWNVAGGYAGQVSIGHASFFGIGAYAGALMVTRFSKSPWLGMILGVVVSIGAGLVIGFLSNRLKGPYFALSTIALSQVLLIAVSRWRGFTAGGEGIPVPYRPGFATLGLGHVAWVYMALAVAIIYYGVEVYLEHSRIGYQLAGVPESRRRGHEGVLHRHLSRHLRRRAHPGRPLGSRGPDGNRGTPARAVGGRCSRGACSRLRTSPSASAA